MQESINPAIVYIPPIIAHILMMKAIRFLWFLVTFSVMGENSKLNINIECMSVSWVFTSKLDTS
jgi:hypothetical protein